MAEIIIGNRVYRPGRLDAFKQLHVYRRLAPVIAEAGAPLLSFFVDLMKANQGRKPDDAVTIPDGFDPRKALGPLSSAIAKLPDGDADYVIMTCLSTVTFQVTKDGPWVNLIVSGRMMHEDLGLGDIMKIVWGVLQENLAGFFSTAAPS